MGTQQIFNGVYASAMVVLNFLGKSHDFWLHPVMGVGPVVALYYGSKSLAQVGGIFSTAFQF